MGYPFLFTTNVAPEINYNQINILPDPSFACNSICVRDTYMRSGPCKRMFSLGKVYGSCTFPLKLFRVFEEFRLLAVNSEGMLLFPYFSQYYPFSVCHFSIPQAYLGTLLKYRVISLKAHVFCICIRSIYSVPFIPPGQSAISNND